ncbi:MAG: hypothetical protein DMF14_12340 [Verrucomicrobia bacterium]|nr:MAG: hypothetical protein DMF14_12340 [Verrucomicrobiota bacterium]
MAGKVLGEIACNIPFRSASLFLEYLNKLMKKAFCFLALSACFFACQKQQADNELLAQIQPDVPPPAERPPKEIGNTPTPVNRAATPSPVQSITPQSEASVTPTATETPILSPTPTPAISSTPKSTVQTPEAGKKPVATSTPRLRLNPLSTGTPFPQASASAESNSPASSVAPTVPAETGSRAQTTAKPEASTSATASWIRSASGKKRATPSVSPSSSP